MTAQVERVTRSPRFVAVVLSYDAPEHAVHCVAALASQTQPLLRIIVVENPGTRRVEFSDLQRVASCPVDLVRMSENRGPAGGYAEGLRRAAQLSCDGVWVMDDDVAPTPVCLAELSATWEAHARHAIVLPESYDAVTGTSSSTWGWCGALLPRALIDEIGVPLVDLFYGYEDQDYLIDRAQNAGYPLVRDATAVVELARRPDLRRPAWHYYYLPRNATYLYLFRRRHIPLLQRVKRLVWLLYRLFRGIFTTQRDQRVKRVLMFVRGTADGLLGRLGSRVPTTDTGRPRGRGAGPGPSLEGRR